MHVVVVHPAAFADDGRVGLNDRVALAHQDFHRARADVREGVLVVQLAGSLVVAVLISVLARVEPNHPRQALAVPIRRERDIHRDLEPIDPLDVVAATLRAREVGCVVGVLRELPRFSCGHVQEIRIGHVGPTFTGHDELGRVVIHHREHTLEHAIVVALVHACLFAALDLDAIDVRLRPVFHGILVVLSPAEEHAVAV